jgi:signal transduction histidine kinase
MRSLVEELLDLSRLDRERLPLQRRRLDLRDVVRGSVEDHRPQIARKGLRCELHLGSDAVPIDGDSVKLMQVLANVLSNAIKFTPPPGTVHVAAEARGRCAEVTVRDTGAGIAPDLLDEIFDRFRQEHRGRHGGLGLGLPIAKGLVELHGGRITAESAGPGTGCTVRIELPIAASGRAL